MKIAFQKTVYFFLTQHFLPDMLKCQKMNDFIRHTFFIGQTIIAFRSAFRKFINLFPGKNKKNTKVF